MKKILFIIIGMLMINLTMIGVADNTVEAQPTNPLIIYGKVYDNHNTAIGGVTVTIKNLDTGEYQVNATPVTAENGYQCNLGNFNQGWSKGDIISINSSYQKGGKIYGDTYSFPIPYDINETGYVLNRPLHLETYLGESDVTIFQIIPNNVNVEEGETIAINVMVWPNTEIDAVAADYISWDPTLADILMNPIKGNLFNDSTIWVNGKEIDAVNGTVQHTAWGSKNRTAEKGLFITLIFNIKKDGIFHIYLDPEETQAAAYGLEVETEIINNEINNAMENVTLEDIYEKLLELEGKINNNNIDLEIIDHEIADIQERLGYPMTEPNATIYDDLTLLLEGLTYESGGSVQWLLKDDSGYPYVLTLSENQGEIFSEIHKINNSLNDLNFSNVSTISQQITAINQRLGYEGTDPGNTVYDDLTQILTALIYDMNETDTTWTVDQILENQTVYHDEIMMLLGNSSANISVDEILEKLSILQNTSDDIIQLNKRMFGKINTTVNKQDTSISKLDNLLTKSTEINNIVDKLGGDSETIDTIQEDVSGYNSTLSDIEEDISSAASEIKRTQGTLGTIMWIVICIALIVAVLLFVVFKEPIEEAIHERRQ